MLDLLEEKAISRRDLTVGAALLGAATLVAPPAALADDAAPAPAPAPKLAPAPYTLKKDYPTDAKSMLVNMRIASAMTRGTPGMEDTVKSTRSQMNEFVSFYRRQSKVSGMPSFSTLYTAINTLSGHYASYGNKYPVPEKRKTRLDQQYKEIERALVRGK
jgi:photosystem II Psb27 protein